MREEFIFFMKGLYESGWEAESWEKYVITHYSDEILEKVRRKVVEICIKDPGFINGGKPSKEIKKSIQELQKELSNAAL